MRREAKRGAHHASHRITYRHKFETKKKFNKIDVHRLVLKRVNSFDKHKQKPLNIKTHRTHMAFK